ncbi:AzlD domain-containing protein [Derxia gummosa]|uniref:AzlD domain-containing protein n=1 Tax=Derxia gummosa DSM 723 TaxID=1121388 RepID=A0A8B6X362_9BURK|nr:AzlD domain-containing protein [Derxia gummosa]
MDQLELWLAMAGLTFATVATRAGLLVFHRLSPGSTVERALRYAPACALAAIVGPELVFSHGVVEPGHYKLWAGAAATAGFLVTRNLFATLAIGMAVFTALRLVGWS